MWFSIPCTFNLYSSSLNVRQIRSTADLLKYYIMYAIIALVVVIVAGYIIKSVVKPRQFPPGPKWYPFVGSNYIVQKMTEKYGSQWKAFSHLAKEYSTNVLGLKLGSELVVVVFGEENVRKAFTEKAFEGRPNSFFLRLRCLGKKTGITFSDGPLWKIHRNFTVKYFKNMGFTKTVMEKEINNELNIIMNYIEKHRNKPINPRLMLASSVMNILWKFTAGERINEDHMKYVLDLFHARSKAFTMAGGWLNEWPWIRFIFPEKSGYNIIKKINDQLSSIIEEAITKHKQKMLEGDDFIYTFLHEMIEDSVTFTEEYLKVICLDILIAGSQTTSNTLEFALLTVLRNQAIQEKIYNEIKRVLGDESPSWGDSNRLIYTMAFLMEVQRYNVIVPLAGPRRLLSDYKMEDYLLSKDTTVLICCGDVNNDPKVWDEPEMFNPERFIDENGQLKNTEHLYTFGLGRRRCPGESFARPFIFMVFVGILQKYRVECSNGILPSEEPVVGLLAATRPFTIEFIPRS